jgi:hypothetical protein
MRISVRWFLLNGCDRYLIRGKKDGWGQFHASSTIKDTSATFPQVIRHSSQKPLPNTAFMHNLRGCRSNLFKT